MLKRNKHPHTPFGTLSTPTVPGLRFCIVCLILGALIAAGVLFYPGQAMPRGGERDTTVFSISNSIAYSSTPARLNTVP